VGLRFSGLMLLSILLMFADHRHYLQPIRQALSWVVFPLQYFIDQPFQLAHTISARLQTQKELFRENQQLRAKQLLLEFQLQRMDSLETENARLQALLGAKPTTNDKALMAEIIYVASNPYSQQITLNKGARDGVYEGQPVVDAYGVVGQVLKVNYITSDVLLITDITHAIPVQNDRSGVRAIAVGTGDAQGLELSHIANSADFKVGDLLITSGLGDRFPSGYAVGTVSEVDTNPGAPFMRIKIKPAAQLDKIREVLLVFVPEPANEEEVQAEDFMGPQPKSVKP
jgi:rod shape-determining protein MreC